MSQPHDDENIATIRELLNRIEGSVADDAKIALNALARRINFLKKKAVVADDVLRERKHPSMLKPLEDAAVGEALWFDLSRHKYASVRSAICVQAGHFRQEQFIAIALKSPHEQTKLLKVTRL